MWGKIKQIAGFGKTDSWLLAKNKLPDNLYCTHPKLKRLIQKAFTIKDGKKKYTFYEFKEIHDMPSRRYSSLNDYIDDHNRRITQDEILHYSNQCLEEINQNNAESMANAVIILKYMKQRCEADIDVDIVLRLVSSAFFTKEENLLTYDHDIGNWKIDLFERHGLTAFFLLEPLKKWLPQTDISGEDMRVILQQKKVMSLYLKELGKLGISMYKTTASKEKEINSI